MHAQVAYNFESIDEHAKKVQVKKQTDLEHFTKEVLTIPATTDIEKVRAIYTWIAHNIRYDVKNYHKNTSVWIEYSSEEELKAKEAALKAKQLKKVLRTKKGICGDYSNLFMQMCAYVGIETVEIVGFAKGGGERIGALPRGENHAWNAFKIKDQWHLVDVTWGAGYTNGTLTKFMKSFSDAYFMMSPENMIKEHFPDDEEWQLLDKPYSKRQFANQPVFHAFYWRLGIESISPSVGEIESGALKIVMKLNKSIDIDRFIIVNGGDIIEYPFEKKGDVYIANINLASNTKRLIIAYMKDEVTFDYLVEYNVH